MNHLDPNAAPSTCLPSSERVVCETCSFDGRRSRIRVGETRITLMAHAPYYDEVGRYHDHNSNVQTRELACSNGHRWEETSTGSCWCGWRKGQGVTVRPLAPQEQAPVQISAAEVGTAPLARFIANA